MLFKLLTKGKSVEKLLELLDQEWLFVEQLISTRNFEKQSYFRLKRFLILHNEIFNLSVFELCSLFLKPYQLCFENIKQFEFYFEPLDQESQKGLFFSEEVPHLDIGEACVQYLLKLRSFLRKQPEYENHLIPVLKTELEDLRRVLSYSSLLRFESLGQDFYISTLKQQVKGYNHHILVLANLLFLRQAIFKKSHLKNFKPKEEMLLELLFLDLFLFEYIVGFKALVENLAQHIDRN